MIKDRIKDHEFKGMGQYFSSCSKKAHKAPFKNLLLLWPGWKLLSLSHNSHRALKCKKLKTAFQWAVGVSLAHEQIPVKVYSLSKHFVAKAVFLYTSTAQHNLTNYSNRLSGFRCTRALNTEESPGPRCQWQSVSCHSESSMWILICFFFSCPTMPAPIPQGWRPHADVSDTLTSMRPTHP